MYYISQSQKLPITLDEAWSFFSNPNNLAKLTPPWMKLTFDNELPKEMYEGMIITQQLRPIFQIRLRWVTEITTVKEKEYFIDEQRIGPYRFWHHEHRFLEIDGGIEIVDCLHYVMPFGILGRLAHRVSVERKIKEVFKYRYERLEEIFGKIT